MIHDPSPVGIILSTFIPLGVVGIILGTIAIVAYHRQVMRSREIAADLIVQMLGRKMSVDEICRVLLVWSQDAELVKKLTSPRKPLREEKAEPHLV